MNEMADTERRPVDPLLALLDNRQMPDSAKPDVTLGELRALRGAIEAAAPRPEGLDVERLRRAIHAVSVRHDWAHAVDTEDRTQEIAAEYARLSE